VEDSESGVKAGKAAGCYTVALLGTTPESVLKEAGADKIIHSLKEIEEIIKTKSENN
jgi:beta-phosphoglucomutase-like phosphatase (HAD superfamily)